MLEGNYSFPFSPPSSFCPLDLVFIDLLLLFLLHLLLLIYFLPFLQLLFYPSSSVFPYLIPLLVLFLFYICYVCRVRTFTVFFCFLIFSQRLFSLSSTLVFIFLIRALSFLKPLPIHLLLFFFALHPFPSRLY